jgi:heme-degrading monooxygenase HmoA
MLINWRDLAVACQWPEPHHTNVTPPRRRIVCSMYIAMNRFKVALGSEAAFEQVWTSRDTHLKEVPGFVEFHLLRGPQREDHVLYSSHTIWSDQAAFEGWTKSEAFRAAHRNAGNIGKGNAPLYLGHPEFEGFEVVQTVK